MSLPTPQQFKADSIYNDFLNRLSGEHIENTREVAKDCSIMCVEEILEITGDFVIEYDFWKEVLEILKAK